MDIDSLKASKKTDQLFLVCVDHYDTSHATFYYYKKEEKWELVLQTPALIGQRGMGEGKEGARGGEAERGGGIQGPDEGGDREKEKREVGTKLFCRERERERHLLCSKLC